MSDFPTLLRAWRKTRRFSQLALALEADLSARHLSFLETGRARPSAGMVGRLCDVLAVPPAERNMMLSRAGFAPQHTERAWTAPDMAPVRAALDHMLDRHAPYPGMAVDRLWRLVRMNDPALRLFGPLGLAEGTCLLDALCSGDMAPFIENWDEVRHHSAIRLRTESAALGGVAELDAAAATLDPGGLPPAVDRPVIPAVYVAGGVRLSLFGMITQFGTPHDIALHDLKVELFFPADAETEAALRL